MQSANDLLDECNRIYIYDPDTGIFTRRISSGGQLAGTSPAGWLGNNGYWSLSIKKKKMLAHRVAWLMHHGFLPEFEIDHKNTNRLDNRIKNLRPATRMQNCGNSPKYRGKSKYKGVCWHKKANKWAAYIGSSSDGAVTKRRHLGLFSTEEEARDAYLAAAQATYGEFSRTK